MQVFMHDNKYNRLRQQIFVGKEEVSIVHVDTL